MRHVSWCLLLSLLYSSSAGAQERAVLIENRAAPVAALPAAPPFGSFDTPSDGATGLTGSIAITGWALDDTGVTKVDIQRDAHPNDPPGAIVNGRVFIGTATFVAGARPDLAALYPTHPNPSNGGWGYLMLTRGLQWDGQGEFNLYAVATDTLGNTATLGRKRISVNNALATKPFGSLDTPGQGQTLSGTFVNFGWVLAQPKRTVPASSVQVAIDGVFLPQASECLTSRSDISDGFPAFDTSQAIRCFTIDTTRYANGLHTIGWVVADNTGQADGIGSRYFTIANPTFTFDSDVPIEDQDNARRGISMAANYTATHGLSTAGYFELFSLTTQAGLIQAGVDVVGWTLEQSQAYWNSGGCGFTGSRRGRKYIIQAARCRWSAATHTHEYFHLIQYRLTEPFTLIDRPDDQTPGGGPRWLLEGTASLVSDKILEANGLANYESGKRAAQVASAKSSSSLQSLESWTGMTAADGGTGTAYQIGYAASDLLVSTSGLSSLATFWSGIGSGLTWQESFRRAFNRTVDAFYTEFALYRKTFPQQ